MSDKPEGLSPSVLAAYWDALPNPYDLDMSDEDAAARHIRSILAALGMTRQPMDTAPKDRLVLLHVLGFTPDRDWAHRYFRDWTIGFWATDVNAWHSVETYAGLYHGDLDVEHIRVEPDGWAPLPEEG